MRWSAKTRAALVCYGLTGVFTIFSFRLVHLQIARHDEYALLAAEKHVHKEIIYGRRGSIRDVHGEVLADNYPVRTIIADGTHINNAEAIAEVLAGPLELDQAQLAQDLTTDRRYVVLKRRVSEDVTFAIRDQLRERNLRGIYFEHDAARYYPNKHMLSHVLGFMSHEHEPVQGIERSMNDYLQGYNGYRFVERDRTGREIVPYRGQERAAQDGYNVHLTIDMGLQNIVEMEIDAAYKEYKPRSIVVLMMRPRTGEILAMANRPAFDLNDRSTFEPERMINHAVAAQVEPGSTFKIVAHAGALNEKLVNPDTLIFCENGRYSYGGRILRDHRPYGMLSVREVLVKSSNIGVAKLAQQMGEHRFYEYVRRFGFGEPTGVELPGEIRGALQPPHRWDKLTITRMPMGHAIAATPVQLVAAMSVIANGGNLMMPQIVSKVTDQNDRVVAEFPPVVVRPVVSPQTAAAVSQALKDVVGPKGTAPRATIKGYSAAGKTGTAQRVDPKGGYTRGKYVVSFLGFFPAEEPEVTMLVIVDDAQAKPGMNYGGLVAAPIFAAIGERAARYLDLPPQEEPMEEKRVALTRSSAR